MRIGLLTLTIQRQITGGMKCKILLAPIQLWPEVLREADLISQPAAVNLLLLQTLPQFYSLSVGHGYLPLSFLVVVPLSVQQVLPLCNGGIPFPAVLVGLGKMLDG